jgi:hypothetical protein
MATIHVNRGGTSLGTFSEAEVSEGLRSGRFAGTDLGWREGMASWQPLSQFSEFASDIPAGAPPPPTPTPPPVTSTITPAPIGSTSSTDTAVTPRSGLPWDDREQRGFLNAFLETLMMVLTKPAEAFTAMRREGGFAGPIIYALIGGCAGALVSFFFSFALQAMGVAAANKSSFSLLAGAGIGSIFFIIIIPVFIVIGLFIGSAIMHLCLMIVGGAKESFETTFRVMAFSQGSTGVIQMIPICGAFIAAIWGIVVNCIGLARAHETDTWRAVLAVFLPIIVCCGGGFFILMMFGALGALGQHS